jgi:hypothetical protein
MFQAGLCLVIMVVFLPETYAPYLEYTRAVKMRKETGDDRYYCRLEANKKSIGAVIHGLLVKPWIMLFQEPMLLAITIYMSFVYGCLYLLFEAFPIIYVEGQ